MKHFKNPKLLVIGIILVLLGAAMIGGAFYLRSSSKEISRVELEQLIEAKGITDGGRLSRVHIREYIASKELERLMAKLRISM